MRASLALLLVIGISGCLSAPAQLQKLDELKEKLRSLHDVLDSLNKNIDSLEAAQKESDKREFAPTPEPLVPGDEELENFVANLSPEDAAAVEKMKSKMKFLQATVHEAPGEDIAAPDGFAVEQPAPAPVEKRTMDSELVDLYNQLPAEDQQLLKDHPSMWSHLDKALHTPGGDPADAVAEGGKREYEDELQNFVSELSDDDKELLKRMKSKLGGLKTALRTEEKSQNGVEISEGKFGEFVNQGEARSMDAGWKDKAVDCDGAQCQNPPPAPDAVDEVEKRLLNDVRYAKDNGVSLKQVLRVLINAKKNA